MEQTTTRKTSRFSKLKVGIAAVAIGALLVVPVGASDRDEDMSVTVEGGDYALALTSVAGQQLNHGNALTYDPGDQNVTGELNLDVTDYTGSGGNWEIWMQASDFAAPDAGPTFGAENLQISSFAEVNVTDGDSTGLTTSGTGLGLDQAQNIITANEYAGGQFDYNINFGLTVPGGTEPSTYTSTVTVDSTEAPSDPTIIPAN